MKIGANEKSKRNVSERASKREVYKNKYRERERNAEHENAKLYRLQGQKEKMFLTALTE